MSTAARAVEGAVVSRADDSLDRRNARRQQRALDHRDAIDFTIHLFLRTFGVGRAVQHVERSNHKVRAKHRLLDVDVVERPRISACDSHPAGEFSFRKNWRDFDGATFCEPIAEYGIVGDREIVKEFGERILDHVAKKPTLNRS
jgi:hypothetical protein